MNKSVEFYTKTLGMIVSRRTTSPRGYPLVFLKASASEAVELELVELPDGFIVPEDLMHIAFEVVDISKFEAILTDGPTKTSSGNIIGFISDPDGYEIELIQR
jgi:catechol 2,3-dioxygenase-like lactoylglutathione lyase family enzyme